MIMPIIVAGGKGTRLWPASREGLPKPYVRIAGEDTLLQATFRRLGGLADCGRPLVVCAAAHDFLVKAQAEAALAGGTDLLLEPEGRNTAPAICAAALVLEARGQGGEPMLVLPADHMIRDVKAFADAVSKAVDLARDGHLVTFAIAPSFPATGYGYLKFGAAIGGGQYVLEAFVEKPKLDVARSFLEAGGYAWNSGMFMFTPRAVLSAFASQQPDILAACHAALAGVAPGPVMKLGAEAFARAPSISIDYAIMEKAPRVAAVAANLGWSDVGDWLAVWDLAGKDADGNARHGNSELVECRGSIVHSDGPLLVGVGLEDMIAVATKDAVVVAPKSRAQDVRLAVDRLTSLGRSEASAGHKVFRPWGSYEQLHIGPGFQVKELTVAPGAKLSLQRHKFRGEHWVCIAGEGVAVVGDQRFALKVDTAVKIPLGEIHRLENPGGEALRIIEVQIGSYTGEDDIERFEDIYGRA